MDSGGITKRMKHCLITVKIKRHDFPVLGGKAPARLALNCPICKHRVIFKRSGTSLDYFREDEQTLCECLEIDRYDAKRKSTKLDIFYQIAEHSNGFDFQKVD